MSKILTVIGDLHLSKADRLKYASIIDGGRLFDKRAFLYHIRQRMFETGSKNLVIIGDFSNSNNPEEFIRKEVIKEFVGFLNAGISISLCVGNHETDGETNCFESIDSFCQSLNGFNLGDRLFMVGPGEIKNIPLGEFPTVVLSGWETDRTKLQESLIDYVKSWNEKPLLLGNCGNVQIIHDYST